ncbi:GntR family transcriptional regulator [Seohaeicola zhoushanensis]
MPLALAGAGDGALRGAGGRRSETARLAALKASDASLDALLAHVEAGAAEYAASGDAARLLEMDEAFHLEIAALSGNSELRRMVENLNDRVRFIRLMFMKRMIGSGTPQLARLAAHRTIAAAIASRDGEAAAQVMRGHIERRREDAAEAVRIAYSQLYVPDEETS